MDNSNKAIAKRINKELENQGLSKIKLFRKILKFKNPQLNDKEIYALANKEKGNFFTALKGDNERGITKEFLYIISKVLKLPLEYIWFGEDKKGRFIPSGPRYVAYQDTDGAYRSFVSDYDSTLGILHTQEEGFNIFDYLGQYDSINGYRFFKDNFDLHFDYYQFNEFKKC